MRHNPNIRPAGMWIDGQEWLPASWADMVVGKLREKQRSKQSHNHQFAAINDMWANLPHSHADAPYAKSAEAFRKHGLIARGYCDVETLDMGSHDAALKAAPFVASLAKKGHGYALTVVRGPLIICSTPHSQSFKAMGKERFHESKEAVLGWAEEMLEVTQ